MLHCWYCSLVLFQFIQRKVNLRHDIHFPHPIPRQATAAEKVFTLVLHQTGCDICAGHLSGTQMMVASLDIRRINLSPSWPCHLNRSCLFLDIYNDIITKMAPGSKQKGSMELFKHQGTYTYRAKSGRKLSPVFNSFWQLCVSTVCLCVKCASVCQPFVGLELMLSCHNVFLRTFVSNALLLITSNWNDIDIWIKKNISKWNLLARWPNYQSKVYLAKVFKVSSLKQP